MRNLYKSLRMKSLGRCLSIFLMAFAATTTDAAEYPFTIEYLKLESGVLVVAINDGDRRVRATLMIKRSVNVGSQREWPATIEIAPASKNPVGLIFPANPTRPWRFQIEGTYTLLEPPTSASQTPPNDFRATARRVLQQHLAPMRQLPSLFNTNAILERSGFLPMIILAIAIVCAILIKGKRRTQPIDASLSQQGVDTQRDISDCYYNPRDFRG